MARVIVMVMLCCLAWTGQLSAEGKQDQPVTFGVFPYVTPVQLVKFHNPVRAYLQEVLGRPVTLVTAPSFGEFIKRTQAGEYDFILTAPHLGRLAQYRDGYQPIAKTGHVVRGIYLVPKDSPVQTLADLEGKTIAMGSPKAIICKLAVRQLDAMGLKDGVNLKILTTRTHNNAMFAPLRGDSDASLTGRLLLEKTGKRERDNVRILGETPAVPGFIFLAAGRIPKAEVGRVTAALQVFGDSPSGKSYIERNGFKKLLSISDEEMAELHPYIEDQLKPAE